MNAGKLFTRTITLVLWSPVWRKCSTSPPNPGTMARRCNTEATIHVDMCLALVYIVNFLTNYCIWSCGWSVLISTCHLFKTVITFQTPYISGFPPCISYPGFSVWKVIPFGSHQSQSLDTPGCRTRWAPRSFLDDAITMTFTAQQNETESFHGFAFLWSLIGTLRS